MQTSGGSNHHSYYVARLGCPWYKVGGKCRTGAPCAEDTECPVLYWIKYIITNMEDD
jgi:hypothetical protein